MTPNLEHMLRRVVHAVFDDSVDVTWHTQLEGSGSEVGLRSQHGQGQRAVNLTVSDTGVFGIDIVDLGVGAALVEYDDAAYMEAIVHELACVARAYLSGAGRCEHKRGLLRMRPVLTISVNGEEWALGRHRSRVCYPEDTSN